MKADCLEQVTDWLASRLSDRHFGACLLYTSGAVGGWWAVLIYIMVLGSTLFLRWRSRAWQAIRI